MFNKLLVKILLVLLTSSFLIIGACCFNKSNIKPDTNLVEHINSAIYSWLDVRMELKSWNLFTSQQASWKTASTLDSLVENIKKDMQSDTPAPSYWDLTIKISDIKSTQLFKDHPLTNEQLLRIIKEAMFKYRLLM